MSSEKSIRRAPSSISSTFSNSSDTLSKYSFHPLLDSPLRSPALPSIVPRRGKKYSPFGNAFRSQVKTLAWLCGISIIFWFILAILRRARPPAAIGYLSKDGGEYELLGGDILPQEPTPVVVTDRRGKPRWTISIPSNHDSPLQPSAYAKICSDSEIVAKHVLQLKANGGVHSHAGHFAYYHVDTNFMDVDEAEEHDLLPNSESPSKTWSWKSIVGIENTDSLGEDLETTRHGAKDSICEKSLTYVMETSDAGFGKTMMGLWMSYGLAKKEGRAFFVDDSNWAYGKYTTFFRPPPSPSCLPAPYTQRLPCPHHARHLLVSASTTSWAFGHAFNENFEDPHKVGVLRQGPIFALLRTGYEALFHLANPDNDYVVKRTHKLHSQIREKNGLMVGVHVRHGDRHPFEYQYQKSYIPLERYVEAAKDLVNSTLSVENSTQDNTRETASRIVLASDDPKVYSSSEVSDALHAQEQILLASKSAMDAAQGPQASEPNFKEDNVGWDGGFFKDVFWNLGESQAPSTAKSMRIREEQLQQGRTVPSELAMRLRELVGRAYLLDLAVLGRADGIVCGVSSVGCRLLAVMMGWEDAIAQQKWHNVDGDFDWKGIVW